MNFGWPGVMGNEAMSPRLARVERVGIGGVRFGDDEGGGGGLEDPGLVDLGVHDDVALAEGGVGLVADLAEFLDVERRDVGHHDRVAGLEVVDFPGCR